jgi:hypothetical protein
MQNYGDQQQLAAILLLTVWHLTQMSSVSLQESVQRGMQQRLQLDSTMHQIMATIPTFFLGRFPVSFPQVGQGLPLPLFPLLPAMMMVWGWAGGGGGGGG